VIVSGPSGAGKSTVLRQLLDRCPLTLTLSVSATTRPPRDAERDGEDYFFLDHHEFFRRREAGEFLESMEVFGKGHWYGTLWSQVASGREAGKWVILEIDVEGAAKVVEIHPGVITIFVGLRSLDEIEQRLRDRGTEDDEMIRRRLRTAETELQRAASYQHFVINDFVDRAASEICDILKQSFPTGGATDA